MHAHKAGKLNQDLLNVNTRPTSSAVISPDIATIKSQLALSRYVKSSQRSLKETLSGSTRSRVQARQHAQNAHAKKD